MPRRYPSRWERSAFRYHEGRVNDQAPRTLGRYEIRRELGRGTMGVVYEAQDPVLHRRVALKAVQLAFSIPDGSREHYEQRFLSEARAAAALSHPGIVVVHDIGRDEPTGTPFIALEYLEGRTLEEMTAGGEPLGWQQALSTISRAAEALHHAHQNGIVHRDIKPANIMLLPSGQPKIMDFGIARLPASQLTVAGDLFGTPSYMSPEQAAGQTADARSDIFSLGCVLYELLTGRRSFDGPTLPAILLHVREEEPPPPSQWVEGLPPEVDAVIGRAMAKDLDERYPDARSFAEDLDDVLDGRPPRHAELLVPLDGDSTMVSRTAPPEPAAPGAGAPAIDVVAKSISPQRRKVLAWTLGASGLVAGGFLAAVILPWRQLPDVIPDTPLAPILSSAHLEITLEHSLSDGTLRVWVDDELMVDEEFAGRQTRKILSARTYKGRLSQTLDLAPGEHVVRVEVVGTGFGGSRRIRGTFESGTTRRLAASVGGLIKKKLNLVWGSTSPE